MKSNLRVADGNSAQVLSPARAKLCDLIHSRDEAAERTAALQASNGRLAEFSRRRDEAAAELAEFDRIAAAEMLAWSSKPAGDAPTVDAEARGKLAATLTAAQENAAAASAAQVSINRDIAAAAAEQKSLEAPISQAIAEVIAEEATGALLDDLKQAVKVAVEKQERLRQAVQAVFSLGQSGPLEDMRPTLALGEKLDDTLRKATAPSTPDGSGHHSSWLRFAAALRSDATASFKE